MSLLLDALDRADKERGQQLVTPCSLVTPTLSTTNEYRVKRWVLEVLIVSLLLGLVVYALFFRSSTEVSSPGAATGIAERPLTPESLMPADLPIKHEPKQETQVTAALRQEAIRAENAERSLLSEQPSTASTPDSVVSKLYQQQNNRETVLENETVKSTPSLKPSPTPTPSIPSEVAAINPVVTDIKTENTVADPKEAFFQQVPLVSDMPTEFKRRIPTLKYSTHVYNKGTQAGFVNINGPFREVGSQIAPGLTLIAILPEGVVLELDGVLFRLRALNDWVGY